MTITANAQTAASAVDGKKQTLFNSSTHASKPYRIPAIATMSNGEVIAIADQRPCGADVGNGDVDIYAKISNNNGAKGSWTPSSDDPSSLDEKPGRIADGGTGTSKGYGDAAVAADPNSGIVVVMSVGAGTTTYGNAKTSTSDYLCIRNYSEDYGRTWKQTDVTSYFKGSGNVLGADVASMFFGSGKLAVSKKIPGRIYGALLVRQGKSKLLGSYISYEEKNYVVYSDDWGSSWKLLGGGACCSGGNEPKVEELPNGDVLLSSRASGARYFNVFNYTDIDSDKVSGSWGSAKSVNFAGSNSTNGEVLLYQGVTKVGDASGTKYNIVLQSLPTGSSRSNVAVYYKAFATDKSSWTVSDFTSGWTKGIEVDNGASAYSTMTIMPNGEIGFLYEDNYDTSKADGDYSDIVFVPLTVSEITGGAYTYVAESTEPQIPTVAVPVIAPNGGNIFDTQVITLKSATEGASIYYTIDGTEPSVNSTLYTEPFTLGESATVKAIAIKEAYNDSKVTSATFNVTKAGTTYRFKNVQKDGTCYYFTYDATNGIGLTTNVEEAAQYARSEGTTSGTYTYRTVDGNYLIFSGRDLDDSNNRGYNDGKGFLTSYDAAKCDLTVAPLAAGGNVESFEGEYYTITGLRDYKKNWISSKVQEQAYFVITSEGKFDGSNEPYYNGSYSSAFLIEEIKINTEPEVKKVATPVFSLPSGNYEQGTELYITCATEGATVYATPDATLPVEEWIDVTGQVIPLYQDIAIYAIAKLEGWEDSDMASAEYTVILPTVPTPVINPNGGKIEPGDKITITCSDANANIYFTIDGTEPTENSTVYKSGFILKENATVKAIAIRDGWSNSTVAVAEFTVNETNEIVVNFEKGYYNGFTSYMSTFSAPFDVTIPSTVKVYIVKRATSTNAYLTRLYNSNIPANTGVVLKASKAGELIIPEAKEDVTLANVSGNILIDTADGEVVLDSEAYVFGKNSSNKYAFYHTAAGEVVPQYSAYFVLNSSKAAALTFSLDDEDGETTAVEGVDVDENTPVEYYNLQGVKVESPVKGVYIKRQGTTITKIVL